jgi:hypothetical protein
MKINQFHKIIVIFFIVIIAICTTNFLSCNTSILSNKKRNENNQIVNMEEQTLVNIKPNKIHVSGNKHNMLSTIKTLCETSREIGSQNEKEACIYLKRQLESYGYETYIQTFNYKIQKGIPKKETFLNVDVSDNEKDGKSQNIILQKKCNSNIQNDIICITAHYDCAKDSKGANDNAAGVAVLMDVARRIINMQSIDMEIRFILFGGEENMLSGSRYYASNLTNNEIKKIKGVINLDTLAQKGSQCTVFYTISGKDNAVSLLLKSVSGYSNIETKKGLLSDYFTFGAMNIPAVNIGQELEGLKFNSSDDTVDSINEAKLVEISNLIISAIENYK